MRGKETLLVGFGGTSGGISRGHARFVLSPQNQDWLVSADKEDHANVRINRRRMAGEVADTR
jgi:hypothetical protein